MFFLKKISAKPLGEILLQSGVISSQQLTFARDYQEKNGGLLGDILVRLRYATEEDIAHALTVQYGYPYLPLQQYEIEESVLQALPEELCRRYCVVPVDAIGRNLTVAVADPTDEKLLRTLEEHTGCTIQVFVSTPSEIRAALDAHYQSREP